MVILYVHMVQASCDMNENIGFILQLLLNDILHLIIELLMIDRISKCRMELLYDKT